MALRALHVWQLDNDGIPKLDKNGERIPHKKLNVAKTYKELNAAERRSFDDQIRFYNMSKQFKAASLLGGISHAQDVIAQAQ